MTIEPQRLPSGDDRREVRILRIGVAPKGDPLFSELATSIEIADEAAGEFVIVSQEGGATEYAKRLAFDPSEWPVIRDAIDFMVGECRPSERADDRGPGIYKTEL